MLSKTASCRQQMCLRPSPYRILLFEISQHLGKQDFENLKSFVNDYGVKDDKGALTEATLEKVSSMFNLLLVATQACFIQPHDLSNLTQFLQLSGYHHLVQKIETFYAQSQGDTPLATGEQHSEEHDKKNSVTDQQAETKPEPVTDEQNGQLCVGALGFGRQQQHIIIYPLTVAGDDMPVHLQKALKCIVFGNYDGVIRSICSHFESVKAANRVHLEPVRGVRDEGCITLDFGSWMRPCLPIWELNNPSVRSDDSTYECILQLIMEAILMAPNSKENLGKLLQYPNFQVPEPLKLLYRARLPSVATDEELQDELASQSHRLAVSLRDEQKQTNFAVSKNALYLAHVYDATAHLNRHQASTDFRAKYIQKADFHERAMKQRQNYEPRTSLEKAILILQSTRSLQSQGYSYAYMATNGPEHPVVRKEHAEKAQALHEQAMNKHAMPLFELLHMHKGMSEGAGLAAYLRFDEMLRMLRLAQLDYLLHCSEWSEDERERKLKYQSVMIVNEFDRIRKQLSDHVAVVPVLEVFIAEMDEHMTQLKEDVAKGCIEGLEPSKVLV